MDRCKWCNLSNSKYIDYHDKEWGVLNLDDSYLLEMLVLESFQAGLSWECVLNKREYSSPRFPSRSAKLQSPVHTDMFLQRFPRRQKTARFTERFFLGMS